MSLESPEPTIFTFESFYSELKLNERVEDVLASLEKRYSSLSTLTDSYKVYPESHKKFLESKLSNLIPSCEENWINFHNEIFELATDIERERDVIGIDEKYSQFKEKIEQWRADDCVEVAISRDTSLVKKRNLQFLRKIHPHTQEFCLRLMNAVEEIKQSKRTFGKTIEENIEEAKKELTKIAIKKFQIARLEKLKLFCKQLKQKGDEEHTVKMAAYSEVTERLRLTQDRLRAKENECNQLIRELRTLPTQSKTAIEDLISKNNKLRFNVGEYFSKRNFQLSKLEHRVVEIEKQTKTATSIVEQEKRHLLEERGKLQVILAKEKALLCQMVKHCKLHGVEICIPGMTICRE